MINGVFTVFSCENCGFEMIITLCMHGNLHVNTEINKDKPDSQSYIKTYSLFGLAVEFK